MPPSLPATEPARDQDASTGDGEMEMEIMEMQIMRMEIMGMKIMEIEVEMKLMPTRMGLMLKKYEK